jgi:hypothetical protein
LWTFAPQEAVSLSPLYNQIGDILSVKITEGNVDVADMVGDLTGKL